MLTVVAVCRIEGFRYAEIHERLPIDPSGSAGCPPRRGRPRWARGGARGGARAWLPGVAQGQNTVTRTPRSYLHQVP
ncbi:unnamed protein product [Gadus morhua 'NCC']